MKFELQQREYLEKGPYHFTDLTLGTAGGIEAIAKLELTLGKMMATSPRLVADLGCGEGVLVQALRLQGISCIGLDLSKQALDLAPTEVKGFIVQADLEQMPLPGSGVDTAAMIAVLEHIYPPQLPSVLSEAKRVIKKGGKLVVRVPSTNQPFEDKHHQHFTEDSLRQVLSFGGFAIEEVIGNHNTQLNWETYYLSLEDFSDEAKYRAYQEAFTVCDPAKAKRLIAVCANV